MSINPRFQAFEKFVSGMYLGEITRNILLALIDAAPKPLLFNGRVGSGVLNEHYGLDTAVMSNVELAWAGDHPKAEPTEDVYGVADKLAALHLGDFDVVKLDESQRQRLERVRKVILHDLGFEQTPEDVSLKDAAIVRWACTLVAERAAKLSGCAVAAILVHTGYADLGTDNGIKRKDHLNADGKIGVGVDGRYVIPCGNHFFQKIAENGDHSLIQFYPNFETGLRDSLGRLVGKKVEGAVEIGLAKDGSGVGGKSFLIPSFPQRAMLKLFLSRFGCPDRHASFTYGPLRKKPHTSVILYKYNSKFIFSVQCASSLTFFLLLSSKYLH